MAHSNCGRGRINHINLEKIGGKFFVKLGERYYNFAFLIYCMLHKKGRIIIFNFPPNFSKNPNVFF